MSDENNDRFEEAIYEKILDDEGFLNDLWNTLGATDKYETLVKAGFEPIIEWLKTHSVKEDPFDEQDDSDR